MTNFVSCDIEISDYLNNHTPRDVIILDFAHVCDKVSLIVLLAKLRQLRLSDYLLQWIADFLRERRQRVVFKEAKFVEASVTSGVIQGSSLGLSLFRSIINNLPEVISACDMWLFADDLKAAGKAASETDC